MTDRLPPEGSDAHATGDEQLRPEPPDMTPAPSSPAGGADLTLTQQHRTVLEDLSLSHRYEGEGCRECRAGHLEPCSRYCRARAVESAIRVLDAQAETIRQQAEEIARLREALGRAHDLERKL